MRDDTRTMVEVDAMSEGTTDQLFLALRLAALEQSVAAGVGLPFLADDLFVNFDDRRAEAGFRVLAEVARTTQVLFFTHHPHLVQIAKSVVGTELHSERSEEHTSELQSLMRISYAVFCLKKKHNKQKQNNIT